MIFRALEGQQEGVFEVAQGGGDGVGGGVGEGGGDRAQDLVGLLTFEAREAVAGLDAAAGVVRELLLPLEEAGALGGVGRAGVGDVGVERADLPPRALGGELRGEARGGVVDVGGAQPRVLELRDLVVEDVCGEAYGAQRVGGQLGVVHVQEVNPIAQGVEVLFDQLDDGLGLARGADALLKHDAQLFELVWGRHLDLVEAVGHGAQPLDQARKVLADSVGDGVVFAVEVGVEALFEELTDLGARGDPDVVITCGVGRGAAEVAIFIKDVFDSDVSEGGDLRAAVWLEAHQARAQQARDARFDDVGCVAIRRGAELGEQPRAADATLALDKILDLLRDLPCADGHIAAPVEVEDAQAHV